MKYKYPKLLRRITTKATMDQMKHRKWPQSLQRQVLGGITKTQLNRYKNGSRLIPIGRFEVLIEGGLMSLHQVYEATINDKT
jgi:hypothetical protein